MRTRIVLGTAAAAYLVAALACGARSELPVGKERRGAGGAGGGPPDCVVFNSSAELAPLDVFIMLDASGSMEFPTGDGLAKWWSVREALDTFFYDPESRGIGVALSFFPIIQQNVPQVCLDDAACNLAGACKALRICPSTGSQCQTDEDCDEEGFGDTCEQLGLCSVTQQIQCIPGVFDCQSGQGECQPAGFCENRFTCDAFRYETPVVDVATLPDAGFELLSTIDQKTPEGGTPTLPALTGALDLAAAHAAQKPGNNVIVVLATDGLPTACDEAIHQGDEAQAIANLAAVAAAGSELGIQTFVIGVFSPEEQGAAEESLSAIAEAGGTGQAFIVNTSGSVAGDFREALNQVRLTAKSCQFDIVEGDEPIDYAGVWVRITRDGEEIWIPRVDSLAACDPVNGGFYYDRDLGGPTPPSAVLLCPATCSLLGASPNRMVEIFTTCGPDGG